jgi:hypothetical protein
MLLIQVKLCAHPSSASGRDVSCNLHESVREEVTVAKMRLSSDQTQVNPASGRRGYLDRSD